MKDGFSMSIASEIYISLAGNVMYDVIFSLSSVFPMKKQSLLGKFL